MTISKLQILFDFNFPFFSASIQHQREMQNAKRDARRVCYDPGSGFKQKILEKGLKRPLGLTGGCRGGGGKGQGRGVGGREEMNHFEEAPKRLGTAIMK